MMIEIAIIGKNRRYSEVISPDEIPEEIDKKEWLRPLDKFPLKEIGQYNDHFVFGWIESLYQSSNLLEWMTGSDVCIEVTVSDDYSDLPEKPFWRNIQQICQFQAVPWDRLYPGQKIHYLYLKEVYGPFTVVDPKKRRLRNRQKVEVNLLTVQPLILLQVK